MLKAPGSSLLYGVMSNKNALCLKDIAEMKKCYVSVLESGVGRLEHVYEDRGLAWAVKSGIAPTEHRAIAREYSLSPMRSLISLPHGPGVSSLAEIREDIELLKA